LSSAKTRRFKQPANKEEQTFLQRNLWLLLLAAAAIIFVITGVSFWNGTIAPFEIVGGEESAVVLLRSPYDAEYTLEYRGRAPISLSQLTPMIESNTQRLYVDIEQVVVIKNGQEFILSGEGAVASDVVIDPGDQFNIRVTYIGREIGSHYLYGFRMKYQIQGRDGETVLRLNQEYAIYVE
jgi:hypothetical protein